MNAYVLVGSTGWHRKKLEQSYRYTVNDFWKCVDTIGTVPVPWAGHFPRIFQVKYTEAILS